MQNILSIVLILIIKTVQLLSTYAVEHLLEQIRLNLLKVRTHPTFQGIVKLLKKKRVYIPFNPWTTNW